MLSDVVAGKGGLEATEGGVRRDFSIRKDTVMRIWQAF